MGILQRIGDDEQSDMHISQAQGLIISRVRHILAGQTAHDRIMPHLDSAIGEAAQALQDREGLGDALRHYFYGDRPSTQNLADSQEEAMDMIARIAVGRIATSDLSDSDKTTAINALYEAIHGIEALEGQVGTSEGQPIESTPRRV